MARPVRQDGLQPALERGIVLARRRGAGEVRSRSRVRAGGSDPGRVGSREAVGVGTSVLDDALRIEFSRALDSPKGWRLSLAGGLAR